MNAMKLCVLDIICLKKKKKKMDEYEKEGFNVLMVLCMWLQVANEVCKELHLDESNTYLAQGKF